MLYLQLSEYTGSLLVMSSFLKYEDMGVLRDIIVVEAAVGGGGAGGGSNNSGTGVAVPIVDPVPLPVSLPLPVPVPPRSALLDSDSAAAQYRCNTTGASFFYSEEVDLLSRTRVITTHSCPNHFSVCQSSECGGDLVTRALINQQVLRVPLYPAFSAGSPIDTTCTREIVVGVALNGVGIYGVGSFSVSRDGSVGSVAEQPFECLSSLNVPEVNGKKQCHRNCF